MSWRERQVTVKRTTHTRVCIGHRGMREGSLAGLRSFSEESCFGLGGGGGQTVILRVYGQK